MSCSIAVPRGFRILRVDKDALMAKYEARDVLWDAIESYDKPISLEHRERPCALAYRLSSNGETIFEYTFDTVKDLFLVFENDADAVEFKLKYL